MRPLTKDDEPWLKELWYPELGGSISSFWWRFLNGQAPNQHWVGVDGEGFVAFTLKKDGGRTVNFIAINANCRGNGLAMRLLDYVGSPCSVVTDVENAASNRLYEKAGFRLTGQKTKKNGGLKNVWQRF